eukprot:2901380-Prymnesium_polylepis.1
MELRRLEPAPTSDFITEPEPEGEEEPVPSLEITMSNLAADPGPVSSFSDLVAESGQNAETGPPAQQAPPPTMPAMDLPRIASVGSVDSAYIVSTVGAVGLAAIVWFGTKIQ